MPLCHASAKAKKTRNNLFVVCFSPYYIQQTALDSDMYGKASLSCAVYRSARLRGFAMRFAWRTEA
jgi:hypothetical protein